MDMKPNVVGLCFLLVLASTAEAHSGLRALHIGKTYGAKPNQDITEVMTNAWRDACASLRPSRIIVPRGLYKLRALHFTGPCKNPVEIKVVGTLQAYSTANVGEDKWVTFEHVNAITLFGGGTFDGQGEAAWKSNNCQKTFNCKKLPISLRFDFVNNSVVRDITSLNSKNFHINVISCNQLTFDNVKIIAPEDSPNSDGIHLGRSNGVNITNSVIGTGDDCISIGDGNKQLKITNVICGPGHGISVGSLGKYPNEEPVVGVTVKNCTLIGTTNGVRIKSWPDSLPGQASNIHFEDIIMKNVTNPIILDQGYCPWNHCNNKASSKVKISKVSFKKIRGSSACPVAVKIACSKTFPCEGVEVADINLTYNGNQGPVKSECENFKNLKVSGTQKPAICAAA